MKKTTRKNAKKTAGKNVKKNVVIRTALKAGSDPETKTITATFSFE